MRSIALAALLLINASVVLAQTGPELLIRPLMDEAEIWESRGDVLFLGEGETSNDADFRMNVFDYEGRVREREDPFVPRLGWEVTYLDLDTDDAALTQDLADISIAAGVELGTYSGWRSAVAVGVGYAGNSPFGEGSAWYGMATLRVGRKLDEKTSLAFVLDYDGNRSVFPDLPLPGFAYQRRHDATLTYVLGIPVSSITWRPGEPWRVHAAWTLLDSLDARVSYELSSKWRLFGEVAARSEAFSVDDFEDRLLFQQRRAEVGVQWRPWEHTRLLLAGGYSFGGEFSTGFDQRDSDLVADLSDEPYVRFGFERRF